MILISSSVASILEHVLSRLLIRLKCYVNVETVEVAITPSVRNCCTIITLPHSSEDYKQLDEILCQSAIESIVREKSVQLHVRLPLTMHSLKVWI